MNQPVESSNMNATTTSTYVIDQYGQHWSWDGHGWLLVQPAPQPFAWYPPAQGGVAKTSIPFRHGRHIVASLLTGGLWIPFYMMLWAGHQVRRPKQVTRW